MSLRNSVLVGLTALIPLVGPVQAATLLGDEITIVGYFPTLSNPVPPTTVTVDAGDTDRATFGGNSFAHADALQLNFIAPNFTVFNPGSLTPDGGNFISFEDLDFDDGSVVSGVTVLSSFGDFDISDVSFGDDFVRFDVGGLSPMANDSIVLGLSTSGGQTISPIPIPAGLPILLSGMVTLGYLKRRTKPHAR